MKISVQENYVLMLEEVFNPILLKSRADDVISICMRDSGFELNYHGIVYEAKNGELTKMEQPKREKLTKEQSKILNRISKRSALQHFIDWLIDEKKIDNNLDMYNNMEQYLKL